MVKLFLHFIELGNQLISSFLFRILVLFPITIFAENIANFIYGLSCDLVQITDYLMFSVISDMYICFYGRVGLDAYFVYSWENIVMVCFDISFEQE